MLFFREITKIKTIVAFFMASFWPFLADFFIKIL
jgi:hypothetical protein